MKFAIFDFGGDNLCNGRLEFVLGSGFPPVEFQHFGMSMEEAKEKFWPPQSLDG